MITWSILSVGEAFGWFWKGLEHSNQNGHSWNTRTQCYRRTSIVFYGSALTLSLSLWKRPGFKSEMGTSPQTCTLPNLLTTTQASHKTWALPSLLCLLLSAHPNLRSKIQRTRIPVCSILPGLAEFVRNRDIYTHQYQPYVFLHYLSVEKRKQKRKDLCEIE